MNDGHLTEAQTLALVRGESAAEDAVAHHARCAECAERVAQQLEVWRALGQAAPAPDSRKMWAGIESNLVPKGTHRPRPPVLPWAMAALLVLGLGVASWWQVASLRGRILDLEAANLELALNHPSAPIRLAAVAGLSGGTQYEGSYQSLLQILRADPNEHVRLLALDALRPPLQSGELSAEALLGLLSTETSPLVQTDLIFWILEEGGSELKPAIRSALRTSPLHPFVASQLSEM